ncbi:cadmium-translocating P-type ATPase [Candidatus Saccharibacteria bacterium]|nr:cadmium-translocating P-type ATPase [Candidatus Saccharibacteria bacterium]MBI3338431.1 cadmium-translocating P-type ATPase [Candidatus Saccharibacteria bacterium]
MIKKVIKFFKHYKQLGFVVVSILAGLGLDLGGYDIAAHWILGISASINLMPLLWGMLQDLRSGKYGVDILAATAILTSVVLQEFWAAMVIVVMLTGGEALEDYAERRAKKELTALLSRKPKKAHVLRKGKTLELKVSDIVVGDKVIILPGEVVPVDGAIIEGTSDFDESALTGESMLLTKQVGDQLLSGSINIEGAVTIKASHSAADSQYQQIIKLVQSAAASQAPFVRLADRYSIPFTILAFMIAGTAWLVTGDAIRFLEVIVVATPCPLLLGAPIALISGMSRAAKHGIIVKTGSALERLGQVETIAFDKTGTLTRGAPTVGSIKSYNGFSKQDILRYAAALEQSSPHVLAQAVVTAAKDEGIKINPAKQVKEVVGHGLMGRLQGKTIIIGRAFYIQQSGIKIPHDLSHKQTTSYLAIDGKLAGSISFVDEVRPETKNMLTKLKEYGIKHTLMVTGDNNATAQAIAKQAGIETVVADCLPGDKIHAIENVRYKPVAFVGDGVNDAPVLTAADVGIALGARGSTAASESADIVILLDDVEKVAESLKIAKRTFYIAKQSILMGILMSIGLMGIFATGRFKPVHGALIQELVDVTVIFNALRAHGSFKKQS